MKREGGGERDIDFKKLAHAIVELGKSKIYWADW